MVTESPRFSKTLAFSIPRSGGTSLVLKEKQKSLDGLGPTLVFQSKEELNIIGVVQSLNCRV